jgi:hypothetical protein
MAQNNCIFTDETKSERWGHRFAVCKSDFIQSMSNKFTKKSKKKGALMTLLNRIESGWKPNNPAAKQNASMNVKPI